MSMASVPDRLIALALLTQTSMPPNFSTVAETASATDWSSRMSPTIGSAWPPASSIASAAVYTVPSSLGWGSAVLAIRATLAPSRAARTAIARPMPREAPEMKRVWPARVRDTRGILFGRLAGRSMTHLYHLLTVLRPIGARWRQVGHRRPQDPRAVHGTER